MMPNETIDHYLNEFARVKNLLPGSDHPWLREKRIAAMSQFAEKGFPTRKDEAFKYTQTKKLEQTLFSLTSFNEAVGLEELQSLLADDLDCYR